MHSCFPYMQTPFWCNNYTQNIFIMAYSFGPLEKMGKNHNMTPTYKSICKGKKIAFLHTYSSSGRLNTTPQMLIMFGFCQVLK